MYSQGLPWLFEDGYMEVHVSGSLGLMKCCIVLCDSDGRNTIILLLYPLYVSLIVDTLYNLVKAVIACPKMCIMYKTGIERNEQFHFTFK